MSLDATWHDHRELALPMMISVGNHMAVIYANFFGRGYFVRARDNKL
jgi:hypothetical protein